MRRLWVIMLLGAFLLAMDTPAWTQADDPTPNVKLSAGATVGGLGSRGLKRLFPQTGTRPFVYLDEYLKGEEGKSVRVLLLSFCASWCEPCRAELPHLLRINRDYRVQGLGLMMIGIDEDDAGIAALRNLLLPHQQDFPILSDRYRIISRTFLADSAPLPANILLSRDFTFLGAVTGGGDANVANLERLIRTHLGLPEPSPGGPPAPARAKKP